MKKALSIMLLILLVVSASYAETDEISISLNGEPMVLEEQALIVNGRTLVPVKFIFEPLGLNVSWNGDTRTATGTKENLIIEMTIDNPEVSINGVKQTIDVAPMIINDRTYVPLRFVAESTGAIVVWHGETRSITIEYAENKTYDELLKAIYQDVNDEDGPDAPAIRNMYHEILRQVYDIRNQYIQADIKMKNDLIELAASGGLILSPNLTLTQMMDEFHAYKSLQHNDLRADLSQKYEPFEFNNGDLYFGQFTGNKMTGLGYYKFESGGELIGWFSDSKRNGYLSEMYTYGYDYSFFNDNEEEGLEFTYNTLEDGHAYKLTYYEDGKRTGYSHQTSFNGAGELLHDAYYTFQDDVSVGLEYVKYREGFELFDRGAIDRDVVVQINPNGNIYIAPTDEAGLSDDKFTGFGYLKFSEGVEYIGTFDDWSRLGVGRYYAADDTSDEATNLVDQVAIEILEEIIREDDSEVVKIKAIHDYLATHIIYDPEPIAKDDYKDLSHTAYGALVDGVAVCDGYAEAFKYLLDKTGIENKLIFGEVDEEGNFEGAVNHAWNLIKMDGQYYHFDLTWNDDDVNNRVLYEYYRKQSDYFDDTHRWHQEDYEAYIN